MPLEEAMEQVSRAFQEDPGLLGSIVDCTTVPSWLEIFEDVVDGNRRVGWRFEFAGQKYGNWVSLDEKEPPLGDDRQSDKLREILTINAWQSLGRILVKPKAMANAA